MPGSLNQFILISVRKSRGGEWSPDDYDVRDNDPALVALFGGFGSKLNAMHQWHEARGIRAIHSTGRRDENNRDYIRWCFADPAAAEEFAEAFADMIA